MITPVVLSKIIAGILAIILAIWFSRDLSYEIEQSKIMEPQNS